MWSYIAAPFKAAAASGRGGMPDHVDHPLPLRIERGRAELRIEIQSVVAELAGELHVDTAPDGTRFSTVLGDQAKLLSRVRAPKAADALRQAVGLLQHRDAADATETAETARQVLAAGLATQRAVVARRRQALAAAQFSHAPEATVQLEQAGCAGEEAGKAALEHVIETLDQQGPEAAAQAIAQHQNELADAARQPWAELAELLWKFDANVQDRLAAVSET
jgi:hypothetical protein